MTNIIINNYDKIKFIDSTITHMRQLYNDIMGNYTLVEDYYLRSLGMSITTGPCLPDVAI